MLPKVKGRARGIEIASVKTKRATVVREPSRRGGIITLMFSKSDIKKFEMASNACAKKPNMFNSRSVIQKSTPAISKREYRRS